MIKPAFTKRERAAIAIATLDFVGVSAMTHLAVGGFVAGHFPRWSAPVPDQSPIPIAISKFVKPTPTLTPVPTPTPHATSQPLQASPRPAASATIRLVHLPPIRATRRGGPSAPPAIDVLPPPSNTVSPAPGVSIVPAGGDDRPKPATRATFNQRVVPAYSQSCIDQGADGNVVIDVTIGPGGTLAAAWIGQSSGFGCLDDAALAAAKESTYNPPEVDGRPVTETYLIVYEFSLDS